MVFFRRHDFEEFGGLYGQRGEYAAARSQDRWYLRVILHCTEACF